MPSPHFNTEYLESVIEFCTNNKVPFATKSLTTNPKQVTIKQWIASASNIILNDVIPDGFWKEYKFKQPTVPNSLSDESNDNGLNVLLLILWASFSDITHDAIITCLKSGLYNWKYSDSYTDINWVESYIACICQYLKYYIFNRSKFIKEKKDLWGCIDSHLALECFLLGQVVKYTSEFFRILVDPQSPVYFVPKFFNMLTKKQVQLDIQASASPNDLTILDLNCNIFYLVSISAWFKGGHCIPALCKYFKIPSVQKLAKEMIVVLNEKHKNKAEYLNRLEDASMAATKELKIDENGKTDNPGSRLIVFTWLVTDFVTKSNRKVTTEKEVTFLRMFFPSFVKGDDDQSIKSKLVELIVKKDPPIFPRSFVVDMIESHFELHPDEWAKYFLYVDSETFSSDASFSGSSSTSNEIAIVSTPKATRKSMSKGKISGRKSVRQIVTCSTKLESKDDDDDDDNDDDDDDDDISTPVTSNVKANVGRKRKAAPVKEKRVGKCSYSNCNMAQSPLQKCAYCQKFNIHYQCHKVFFLGKKIPKDSNEPTIKLCWNCSKHTSKPPKTVSNGNKKRSRKTLSYALNC